MRLLIKLYLWVSSKSSSGFAFKGDLKSGSLGFAIPIYALMIAVAYPIEKIFRIDIPYFILLFVSILLTFPIYFYYKKNGRGQSIIDYYDHHKINKWYYVVLLSILYYLFLEGYFLELGTYQTTFLAIKIKSTGQRVNRSTSDRI